MNGYLSDFSTRAQRDKLQSDHDRRQLAKILFDTAKLIRTSVRFSPPFEDISYLRDEQESERRSEREFGIILITFLACKHERPARRH
jgi:hypothetical protein